MKTLPLTLKTSHSGPKGCSRPAPGSSSARARACSCTVSSCTQSSFSTPRPECVPWYALPLTGGPVRKGKPNDPQRRARILQAAVGVIGDEGVHATSYRRVAARAGVPLGAVTYYFTGLETLIVSAC